MNAPLSCSGCLIRSGVHRWQLPADAVREVIAWPRLTVVPLAPAPLLGVFSYDSVVVPLIDPVALLAGPADSALLGPGAFTLAPGLRGPADRRETRRVAVLRARCGYQEILLALAADEVRADDGAGAEPLDLDRVVAAMCDAARPAQARHSGFLRFPGGMDLS